MVRGGDNPQDYRSEAERVGARCDDPGFNTEYHRGKRAPTHVDVHDEAARFETVETGDVSEQGVRSDPVIRQRVVDSLGMEPWASTSDITVEVAEGVVLLTGSVDSINTKYRAEEVSKRFPGVERVDNQLKIRVGDPLDEFTRGFDSVRARNAVSSRGFDGGS